MKSDLPISIQAASELIKKYSKLKSLVNRLEAQVNFQTMTSGWYGDEESIIEFVLFIESSQSFQKKINNSLEGEKIDFSDDVVNFYDSKNNTNTCFIALTDSESCLLDEHEKLLNGLLNKKLTKVLNLLAIHFDFKEI